MSKGCNSCSTSCDMHGGSRSVITPAGGAQGVAWSEPNNLPGSDGRDVSQVGNHFSFKYILTIFNYFFIPWIKIFYSGEKN